MTIPTTERPQAVAPARYITIKGAAAAMGLSEGSIRKRLERGIWLEGQQWRKAPDGRIYIDMKAVEAWVESKETPNG